MSKPDTWMPLVIGDYLADTGHLSTAEHGAYLLLLMTAWMRGGALPDDDAQLARITRASATEWRKLRPALAPFFMAADGVWRQKRLLKELAEAQARTAAAGAKAVGAAATRWGKHRVDDAPSIAPSNAQAMPEHCPPSIPSSSLRSEEQRLARKERPLPENFAISERVRDWANRKGFRDLERYHEIFVGRYLANGKKYADWDQTFMNAIREDWYGVRAVAAGGRSAVAASIFGGSNGQRPDDAIDGTAERVA